MSYFAPRTCTEIREAGSHDQPKYAESRPLEDFREKNAYVLLGAPGAGKTEAFKREAEAPEDYVTARDFLTLGEHPRSNGAPLFIDALDERRAGLSDGSTPLDKIRKKLIQLGRPRFRLSCREADWFGANDRQHLKAVSPDGGISVIRLDPLPEKEVSEVLRKNLEISDPARFIASANEQSIGDLLSNPQTLRMLAKAVKQSGEQAFPRSRTETFDLACRQLLSEHSDEHRLATGEFFAIDALMDTAGRLCAVQLLTGAQGYRLPGGTSAPDFPHLEEMATEDGQTLRHVLKTKLFHTLSEGHVAPVHRQVAEFLAARYLADLISDGLPPRRVLALMIGYDGGIVSELRGLSAWLAAHSKPGRTEIIARDPLGTLLYGDVRNWPVHNNVLLLEHLNRESKRNPWSVAAIKSEARFGDISTPDMAGEIRKRLENPARDDVWQSFISIVVEMLRYGDPLPGIAEILLDVARDDSRWPRIRQSAIHAFIRQRGDATAYGDLKSLLDDIYAQKVRDPGDNLFAWLLRKLYPQALSAPELLKYLRVPKGSGDNIEYGSFWTYLVPKDSTAEQLAQLLDGLVERHDDLKAWLKSRPRDLFPEHFPITLLSEFLKKAGEEVNRERLFDWLGLATWMGDWNGDASTADEARYVVSWLEQHPAIWKSLWEKGLRRCIGAAECASPQEFFRCMAMEERRVLFTTATPRDLGRWHLDQALTTEDPVAQDWLMYCVAQCVHNHSHDQSISLAVVWESLAERPELKGMFEEKLSRYEESRVRDVGASQELEARRSQFQEEHRLSLKPHETAFRENRAAPQLLYNPALVYLREVPHVTGETPKSRLYDLFGDDHDLVESALEGLRGAIDRRDIPSDDEVIKLNCENKRHFLALPILAGLEERATAASNNQVTLDDDKLRAALAIHYTEPHWGVQIGGDRSADQKSLWFPPVLRSHPHIVAEVLTKFAGAKLRSGTARVNGLYDLAHSEDFREVAQLATLRLLEMFPVRCRDAQLQDLLHLLRAAALNVANDLTDLIERKLANRSMNLGQRVYWLAVGLLIAPDKYVEQWDGYATGSKRRVENLVRYLVEWFDMLPGLLERLDVSALKLLIRLVGATSNPDPASWDSNDGENAIIGPRMDAALRIRDFIGRLASNPSAAATTALQELSLDDNLRAWRPQLLDAADQQEKTRREGDFKHCSVEQALAVLRNEKPANVADLAALVADQLFETARNIRDGSASDWRQYWNVDSHNRPQDPRPEDACRDALLSDLQQRLSVMGIDVQPEGRYANDKRADIRVSCNGLNVPMEIKKSCHRDLWSAIEKQLVAKYARDPGADGYGIYVVFWFGNTEHCRPTPGTAGVPRSAAELEQRLSESLSQEVRRKISVCVIDVAKPQA